MEKQKEFTNTGVTTLSTLKQPKYKIGNIVYFINGQVVLNGVIERINWSADFRQSYTEHGYADIAIQYKLSTSSDIFNEKELYNSISEAKDILKQSREVNIHSVLENLKSKEQEILSELYTLRHNIDNINTLSQDDLFYLSSNFRSLDNIGCSIDVSKTDRFVAIL